MPDKRYPQDELSLADLLSDPIVWTVMKSDGVDEHELRDLLARVAHDLTAGSLRRVEREISDNQEGAYRRGVGIMLLNEHNEVFVGQRADSAGEAWQMPQGGINGDEEPRVAALRELKEEIGTDKARIVAESKNWLRYELPPDVRRRWGSRSRWIGQQQKWFVMRFEGTMEDINLATAHPEFSAWKWASMEELPGLVVAFKRKLYLNILKEFSEAVEPH